MCSHDMCQSYQEYHSCLFNHMGDYDSLCAVLTTKTPAPFEGRRISVCGPQGDLRLLLFFATFATKNIMQKFSPLSHTVPELRQREIEEFNLSATENNLRMARKSLEYSKRSCESAEKAEVLSKKSLTTSRYALIVAIVTLVVAVLTLLAAMGII